MVELKKHWVKPQLVVLVRGTPEERVLAHCKRIGYGGGNPLADATTTAQTGCDKAVTTNCGACQSRSGS